MNKQSILIIDDSKLVNNSLKDSLEKRNYSITQAFDIATAKQILLDESFDYALLDLVLPDGKGEELLPFLQIHEELRVIVLTSDRDSDRRENLFNFGSVVDYITKERYFDEMELSIVQLIERISTNNTLNVLIVDDSSFMRTHLRMLLAKRGFKTFTAIDGKEALQIIKQHKIDAAIVDLEMPVMNGMQLIGAIRRNKANLLMPVMVVSGTSDASKVARVIKNGANDFIRKPYPNEELLLKIDKMMEELKQQRLIKVHETRFAMYNKAIEKATIFLKLDSDLNITYTNEALCEILTQGLEVEEGTYFGDYIHASQKQYLDTLKTTLLEGETYQRTFRLQSDTYNFVSVRLTFTPLKMHDGTLDEVLVIGFDVSLLEQKENVLKERVESELKKNSEQNKILIQQTKLASMGEMIAHIGHQWRQPLSSLGLIFQKINLVYKKDKLSDEFMQRSTDKAMDTINHMSQTIDDFRNFFKDDKNVELHNLTEIIDKAHALIASTLNSNKIKVTIIENDKISLLCIKNELSQVILNLLTNAMDALLSNNIENPLISITIKKKDKSAIIIITDNAGGIPEDISGKIFEPYFTTKQKTNGTGIGLYMSQTIIHDHMQGSLNFSNTAIGASFKITLPIKLEDAHE